MKNVYLKSFIEFEMSDEWKDIREKLIYLKKTEKQEKQTKTRKTKNEPTSFCNPGPQSSFEIMFSLISPQWTK